LTLMTIESLLQRPIQAWCARRPTADCLDLLWPS